jgi:hypothetical protein
MLINAIATFSRNVQWAAHFFLHPEEKPAAKEWYGFKSLRAPPKLKELEEFQEGLLELVDNVEFNKKSNQFLESLKDNLKDIDKEKKIYVAADKTSNKYLMDPEAYTELLEKSVQAKQLLKI